jgi:hypothetical protein
MRWRKRINLSRQKKLLVLEVDARVAGTKAIEEDGADADGITARRHVRPWE